MKNLTSIDEFIGEQKSEQMEIDFDESQKKNTIFGKTMPPEFMEIAKNYENKIVSRKENMPRFNNLLSIFLKTKYNGELGKTIADVARKLDYPKYLVDLYVMDESEYKSKYQNEYKDFFENLTDKNKYLFFQSADWGARTVFETKQDTVAGNILEDMISHYSFGAIKPNKDATGRYKSDLNTKCDLIYDITHKGERIIVPIEIKSRWSNNIVHTVGIRGSSKKIFSDNGMVLCMFPKVDVAYLFDSVTSGKLERGTMSAVGKECDNIYIDETKCFDFKFWVEEDMRNFLNLVYKKYKERYVNVNGEK